MQCSAKVPIRRRISNVRVGLALLREIDSAAVADELRREAARACEAFQPENFAAELAKLFLFLSSEANRVSA